MAVVPPIARPLARRIDGLARRAHAFHRFAHHPLCDRYQTELVPLGHRVRVCRGCSLALLGAIAGAAIGALSRGTALEAWVWGLPPIAIALGAAPLGHSKLLRRFLPTLLLAGCVVHGPWGLASLAAALTAGGFFFYRRRRPDRSPCATCPERAFEVCRGYRPIVRRELAFRRLSGRWLEAPLN